MKKIMFSDKFQLTEAVFEGRKTMTRRLISEDVWQQAYVYRHEYYEDTLELLPGKKAFIEFSPFKVGEVVAVAQSYDSIIETLFANDEQWRLGYIKDVEDAHERLWRDILGRKNKMYVRADLMPHQIRITNVRVERLQDISEEDCLKEGIYWDYGDYPYMATKMYKYDGKEEFIHPKAAFAALIDKISGKGTFESNPWVFVYEFELIK